MPASADILGALVVERQQKKKRKQWLDSQSGICTLYLTRTTAVHLEPRPPRYPALASRSTIAPQRPSLASRCSKPRSRWYTRLTAVSPRRLQALEPSELVVEFRPRLRIAVRQVDRGDDGTPDRRLDESALYIVGIARQLRPRHDRLCAPGEDRDPVPAFLSAPCRALSASLASGMKRVRTAACKAHATCLSKRATAGRKGEISR